MDILFLSSLAIRRGCGAQIADADALISAALAIIASLSSR